MAPRFSFAPLILSVLCIVCIGNLAESQSVGAGYRGKYIGPITSRKHKVTGEVFAVDSRTLHIRGFTYDGTGPDAFFWTGFTEAPGPQGIIIPNERGTKEVLRAYNGEDITISLPDGLTLRDVKWIGVWCRAYEVNFGDIYIPVGLDYPQPHVIGSLQGQYGVSSGPVVVVDAQTILVPDFTYDGTAPDLHFWVGSGTPGPQGFRVPDETGSDAPLAKADKKTMVLSLPGDLTVFDIDYFGVWCRLYSIDFGHVRVTPGLNVPPSLRMLGVSPQSKLNCEVLNEERAFEVRWSVVESGETVVFQLVGKIEPEQYMAFGLSGENDRSIMIGGDAMVGWVDRTTGRGNVMDYHLSSKSTCKAEGGNSKGSCPDAKFKDGSNNVRMLNAAVVDGFTILTFQRKLKTGDAYDKSIRTNGTQPVIWAVGKIDSDLAGYHNIRTPDDFSIDFGRLPKWNCPEPEQEPELSAGNPPKTFTETTNVQIRTTTPAATVAASSHIQDLSSGSPKGHPQPAISDQGTSYLIPSAWRVPPIPCSEPEDRIFYAQIGPSGRKEVFKAITGKEENPPYVWYINGLLMPEISLRRHKNYTFVIQGGDNPFYITDDPEGGSHSESTKKHRTYAGVQNDNHGQSFATASGKLCQWTETQNQLAETFSSYAAYQRSLTLDCKKGSSGVLQFTPDDQTPNVLYYQSYTNRNLGWKIHIVDECDGDKESPVSRGPGNADAPGETKLPVSSNHLISLSPTTTSQLIPSSSDQQSGGSVNRDTVISFPGFQNQNFLPINELKPSAPAAAPGPQGFPQQTLTGNTYVFDPSSGKPQGLSSPYQQSIHPADTSRFIFNGNSASDSSVNTGQSSVVNSRQGQIMGLPPRGSFQFSSNPGPYQILLDPSAGGESQSQQYPQNIHSSSSYQMPGAIPFEGGPHILKRAGYTQQLPLQQSSSGGLPPHSPYKFNNIGRPEIVNGYDSPKQEQTYYGGGNREPVVPQYRYDSIPHHQQSVIYASTIPPQRHNSPPMTFPSHDKPVEIPIRMPQGPGPMTRVQNIPRRATTEIIQGSGGNQQDNLNVKYVDYPHSPVQILQSGDGRFNGLQSWTHTRNLPKRDHKGQGPLPSGFFTQRTFLNTVKRNSRNDGIHNLSSEDTSSSFNKEMTREGDDDRLTATTTPAAAVTSTQEIVSSTSSPTFNSSSPDRKEPTVKKEPLVKTPEEIRKMGKVEECNPISEECPTQSVKKDEEKEKDTPGETSTLQEPVQQRSEIDKEHEIVEEDNRKAKLGSGVADVSENKTSEGPDSLSLTLLTDVWQIINQQGISNSQSKQKPQMQQNQAGTPKPGPAIGVRRAGKATIIVSKMNASNLSQQLPREKEMEEKEFDGIKKKTHPHGISSEVPTSPNFS